MKRTPDPDPKAYVTKIGYPPADRRLQRIHVPMKQPAPVLEAEPEAEAEI